MRTIRTKIWFLRTFTLMVLLHVAHNAWAQNSGGLPAAPHPDEPQVAQPAQGGVNWKDVGIGAGTAVTNLLYFPVKLTYGILGGIGGAAGYALTGGNKQVADSIWRSSLGGDYVLTPDMMTGKEPIYFSGPSDAATTQAAGAGSNPLPPSGTASTPETSLSTPGVPPDTALATHPIDSGAGPVGATGPRTAPYAGAINPGSSYRSYEGSQSLKRSASPDTSIE